MKLKWKSFSNEQKVERLIDYYLPWHIQFLQGWLNQDKFRINFFSMKDIIKDPYESMKLCFKNYDLSFSKTEINFSNEEIMFNKDHNIEKIILTENHKNKIKDFVERNDFLNQNLISYL